MSEITDAEVHNPNMQKYLASIGTREGTDTHGYNTQVGGGSFSDLSQHPNNPTVVTDAGVSTAAGKYQITGTTFRGLQKQYPSFTDFSADTQDKAAVALIKEKGADADVAAGNYAAADSKLKNVWESFKDPADRAKVLSNLQRGISGTSTNKNPLDNIGNSPSDKIMSQMQSDAQPPDPFGNIGTGLETFWKNDLPTDPLVHAVNTLGKTYQDLQNNKVVDPNFVQTKEVLSQALDGVNSKYIHFITDGATSLDDMMQRRATALAYEKQEEKYAQAGFGSGIARMAAGMISPTNFAVMGAAMLAPELGIPTAASRFGKMIGSAAEGALINGGLEAATYKNRPEGSIADVGYAALMGLGLGAAGGALGRSMASHGTLFADDLRGIQHWSMDELHNLSADDYAKMKLVGEHDVHMTRTPDEQSLRVAELKQEYSDLYHQRYSETVHGTGDFVAGEAPKEPVKKTYSKEWDTPSILEHDGNEYLQLPPKQSFGSLVDYIREHSPNKALVAQMDNMLKGIDTSKIRFFETGSGKAPEWYVNGSKLGSNAAHVFTPTNSLGTKAGTFTEFVQKGTVKSRNAKGNTVQKVADHGDLQALNSGLVDQTFVHELTHVAAVYKQRLYARDKTTGKLVLPKGIVGDQRTTDAVQGLDSLHQHILKTIGKQGHYGMTNAYEFLAEGLTNPKFQEFLKGINLPSEMASGNAFTRFVSHVMDLMGLNKEDQTALHRLLELAEPLTEEGGISRAGEAVSGSPRNGYRAMPDSKATGEDVLAAETANIPPVWALGLGLENRLYKSGLPEAVHKLANKLFGSSIGYKDHGVVGATVWDDHKILSKGWNMQLRKGALLPFVDWMKENNIKMMDQGRAHDQFFEQVWMHVKGVPLDDGVEFDPHVVRASQAMQKNYSEVVKHINNPAKSVGGTKLGLTETEHTGLDGTKSVQGTLAEDPHYMPRVHDANKWDHMVNKHGIEDVRSFWASAYMSGRDALTTSAEDGAMFGKWYVKVVNTAKNQASSQHLTDMMRGQDNPALIESLMDILNLDKDRATQFADHITGQTKDSSGKLSGNLKHRSNIDETFVGAKGSPIEGMSLKDFVKTNAFNITEGYNDRMSGLISLAKNMDIYKVSDIKKAIGEALKDNFGDKLPNNGQTKLGREALLTGAGKDLQFAFDRILGVPQVEGFSPWRKGAEMLRNFNVIRLMSGAVYNQLVETAGITGTVGYKAMMRSMSEMEGLSRDMRTGNAPHEILNHLENYMGGAGGEYLQRSDYASHTAWTDHYGATKGAQFLDKLDSLISKGASGVLNKTGMTGLMVQQKRNWALSFVNGLVDLAHGIDNGGAAYLTKERLAHLGYSEEDFGKLKVALKKYTSGTTEGVILPEIKKFDIEGFAGNEPALHHQLMAAVMRESDRVIQENDLAAMIPFMGTTVGQLGFQFMGFSMQAWNKQLMFSMHHADAATVNTMFQGIFFGSLVYSARIYQQSLGMEAEARQKYLDDHLSPAKIVANGWGRTGASSMLPNLAASLIPGASDLFAGGRTTSDLSGIMSNPTLGLAQSLVTLAKKSVVNPLDDTKQFTKSDYNSLFKLMPMNNLIGVNNVLNSISSNYPVSSKETPQ